MEWGAHGPVRRTTWNGWETRFSYDSQGNPIAEVERDDDGQVRRRIRRWFDGKRLRRVATFLRGERCDTERLSYDAQGRKARSVVRGCDGHIERVRYQYGANTTEIREADDGGAWHLERRETFDVHGRVLTREVFASGALGRRIRSSPIPSTTRLLWRFGRPRQSSSAGSRPAWAQERFQRSASVWRFPAAACGARPSASASCRRSLPCRYRFESRKRTHTADPKVRIRAMVSCEVT